MIETNTQVHSSPTVNTALVNHDGNQQQNYQRLDIHRNSLKNNFAIGPVTYTVKTSSNFNSPAVIPSYVNPGNPRPFSPPTIPSRQFTTPTPVTAILTLPAARPTFPPKNGSASYRLLGERCEPESDTCPQHADCILHVCACIPGYEPGNGWCSPVTDNDRGGFEVIRRSKICVFLSDYFVSAGKRSRYRAFGETCRLGEECDVGDCVEGRCDCGAKKALINGSCINGVLLVFINFLHPEIDMITDSRKLCYCLLLFLYCWSFTEWELKGTARPGEGCDQGRICSGGSICDRDVMRCICAAQHWIDRGVCVTNGCSFYFDCG